MSTPQQKYSTENQAAAIASYAIQRNLMIVRTYKDDARSGLRIGTRKGLQNLINDVEGGHADFDCVLVYDVSRWGRFQDIDESAYYEFLCKRAGIRVHYCEEQFENDDSFISAIMKNIKRVAAGDYSRDLSVKVFAGSCRVLKLGFKQGGIAGYGLQRVLVDQFGSPKCLLSRGDRKALQTDRVILQPGRPEEVETVRRVFRSFVMDRKSEHTIAHELNAENIFNEFGRPWRMLAVRRLLTCEKYLGHYVYNQKSGKLKSSRKPNPPEAWVRYDNAFEGIIDPVLFKKAGEIVDSRAKRTIRVWKSNAEILSRLSAELRNKGRLTSKIIESADSLPCTQTYIERFGSLRRAYDLIGYHPDTFKCFDARRAATVTLKKIADDLTTKIQGAAVAAAFDGASGRITFGLGLNLSILIIRCQRLTAGTLRWPVRRRIDRSSEFVLAVRMQENNTAVLDYHLIPRDLLPKKNLNFRRESRTYREPFRLATLDAVVDAIQRQPPMTMGRGWIARGEDNP